MQRIAHAGDEPTIVAALERGVGGLAGAFLRTTPSGLASLHVDADGRRVDRVVASGDVVPGLVLPEGVRLLEVTDSEVFFLFDPETLALGVADLDGGAETESTTVDGHATELVAYGSMITWVESMHRSTEYVTRIQTLDRRTDAQRTDAIETTLVGLLSTDGRQLA